ncbi:MAG: DUF1492 domain-containing protein [Ruminococcus sp.]|nr:DUF1492 domain-containing protein [Ruminococcus sp.]
MTPKEYMSQARYLDERINSKIQQITSLNELATKCTSTLSDMPKNPNKTASQMENAIINIISLEEEINKDIDSLVDLKREIMRTIKRLSCTEYQILLEKRYLCFLSWEKIAVDLNFSIQHTYRIHDEALKKISIFLKDESKCD